MDVIAGIDDFHYPIMARGDVDQSDQESRTMSSFQRALFPGCSGRVFAVDCVFGVFFCINRGRRLAPGFSGYNCRQ
jgi:hypothetical protein